VIRRDGIKERKGGNYEKGEVEEVDLIEEVKVELGRGK
jgi:hypothetical protein